MKTFNIYNGIYYALEKTSVPPNAGGGIQSCVGMLNFYQLGSKFIQKIIGSFLFKVMNSPIYSIQREVIKEFESLVSHLAFALCFHKWKQKEQAKAF